MFATANAGSIKKLSFTSDLFSLSGDRAGDNLPRAAAKLRPAWLPALCLAFKRAPENRLTVRPQK